ncbi:MAG: hypothetical protein AAFP97_06365 [Pseudomonadota bacterium]
MKEKLVAIWNFAVALLLYPVAFILLVWIWWTDGSWLWGLLIIGLVLLLDQTWFFLIKRLFRHRSNE